MASCTKSLLPTVLHRSPPPPSASSPPPLPTSRLPHHLPVLPSSPLRASSRHSFVPKPSTLCSPPIITHKPCNAAAAAAAEYVFPDPIPKFADSETDKFRSHLLEKLSKKDIFGDSVQDVVGVCSEILSNFLHTEYGGPGTLLVIPFIDMADTINERGLPGGPQAARAAVVWAQKHIDKDWNEWTGGDSSE